MGSRFGMSRLTLLPLLAALVSLPACSTQAAQKASPAAADSTSSASVHPVSGLDVIPLTVSQNGKTREFMVEVARTPEEQAQGLMFRTEMGEGEGMLFPSETPQVRSFWMKNTVIPLDIIFIGPDHTISNIAANAMPYSTNPLPSDGPAIAVLELNGGEAAKLGIGQGAKVEW